MKLLKLRLLKINGINLKNLYLSSIGFTKNKKDTITISQPKHQINYTPKTNKYDYEYKAILPQAYKQIKQLKMI